jgi:hypothetical protein
MSQYREEDREVKTGAVFVPSNPTYILAQATVEPADDPSWGVLIGKRVKCEK